MDGDENRRWLVALSEKASSRRSSQSTLALVLGILGLLCCPILGPIAWYMGSQELRNISAGVSDASGEGSAQAGKVLGIAGTVLWILGFMAWVGLALIQGVGGL
jgi:hypothetical protein